MHNVAGLRYMLKTRQLMEKHSCRNSVKPVISLFKCDLGARESPGISTMTAEKIGGCGECFHNDTGLN